MKNDKEWEEDFDEKYDAVKIGQFSEQLIPSSGEPEPIKDFIHFLRARDREELLRRMREERKLTDGELSGNFPAQIIELPIDEENTEDLGKMSNLVFNSALAEIEKIINDIYGKN